MKKDRDPRVEQTRRAYDAGAENWHSNHREDTWWQGGANHFAALLKKSFASPRVLDAGCGTGVKCRYLSSRGLSVRGIDFSEAMIAIAVRENPMGVFEVLSMAEAAGMKGVFEGVFASASLLHIPKASVLEVIRKLSAKLQPGGYFYAAMKEKKAGGPDEEMLPEEGADPAQLRLFSFYTREEMKDLFLEAGHSIVLDHIRQSGKTSWIQIISKKP